MLNDTNGILVNSWMELKALQTDLGWKGENYGVGYYGVDSSKLMKDDSDKFRKLTGMRGDFIMQADELSQAKIKLCYAGR